MHVSIDDYLQSKLALLKSSKRRVINHALMKKLPKRFKDITFMHSDGGNIKNECSDKISQEKYVICSVEGSKFIINANNFKVIGITGTNGKTTTCLFLEHLLIKAGYKARASGNIGNSPLDLIGKLESLEVVVL